MQRHERFAAMVVLLWTLAACGSDSPADPKDAGTDPLLDAAMMPGLDGATCAADETMCGSTCANLQTSAQHCGACDVGCQSDQHCSAGTCTLSCPSGQTACAIDAAGASVCIDLKVDNLHCGGCGMVCPPGSACSEGRCALACSGTTIECNGSCVDPATSRSYCGATAGCGRVTGSSAGAVCAMGTVCGNGVCQVACPGTQIECNGVCIEPSSDLTHCGAIDDCQGANAGAACTTGNVCTDGRCALSCAAGQVRCGGKCVDPQTDRGFCGASADCMGANDGSVCPAGQVCSEGTCAVSCPGTQIACGGECVEPKTDRGYCGSTADCLGINAGSACRSGEICVDGLCKISCPGSQIVCSGTCVDPQTDGTYCGATADCLGVNNGTVCSGGEVCSAGVCALSCQAGLVNCGGTCVNPLTNRTFCGAFGSCTGASDGDACVAGQVCNNGACSLSCQTGLVNCGGTCVNPLSDRQYCGASESCQGVNAGNACAAGQVCSAGVCSLSCQAGHINCGGTCINPQTDHELCGASEDCQGANDGTACIAGEVCRDGSCALSCQAGLLNCHGVCVDPLTDRTFCGASADCAGANEGAVCAAGQVCSAGTCAVSCPGAQIACNGTCIDPLTDRFYCGASGDCQGVNVGSVCSAGQVCSSGSCAVSCPGSQIACNGTCIDPLSNRAYCGASGDCQDANDGTTCNAGQVCAAGACAFTCPGNQINCNGTCIDPQTNHGYCGAGGDCQGASDGTACQNGQVCNSGVCAVSCPGAQLECNATCIEPLTDVSYCGAMGDCQGVNDGTTCPAGQVCDGGMCVVSCPGSQIACGGSCIDPQTDLTYCGATGDCQGPNDGTTCAAGQVCGAGTCAVSCPGGQIVCNGTCVDPQTSRTYCGASADCQGPNDGTTCGAGEVCSAGTCAVSCPGSQIVCGGICVDRLTDRGYCGATGDCLGANDGTACAAGQVCSGGACAASCPGTQINCNGTCIEPTTNRGYCGATGNCQGANDGDACDPGEVCSAGVCATSCASPQIVCAGNCVNPLADRDFCGATGNCLAANDGNVCSNGQVCSGGSCTVSCPPTQVVCSGMCVDPLSSRAFCGASGDCIGANRGAICGSGQVCSGGVCAASCQAGTIACGGGCIDPDSNPAYCGASGDCGTGGSGSAGTSCTSRQACLGGACVTIARKLVFVTSSTWLHTDLGGLAGADLKCQQAAVSAGLSGTYRAWISSSSVAAHSRLTHSTLVYAKVNGVKVADNWTDLADGTLDSPIDLTEFGTLPAAVTTACSPSNATSVWTNTASLNGVPVFDACSDWTAGVGSTTVGNWTRADLYWSSFCSGDHCHGTAALYCIQM